MHLGEVCACVAITDPFRAHLFRLVRSHGISHSRRDRGKAESVASTAVYRECAEWSAQRCLVCGVGVRACGSSSCRSAYDLVDSPVFTLTVVVLRVEGVFDLLIF